MHFVVSSRADLRALLGNPRATALFARHTVELRLAQLPEGERARLETELNAYQDACGCGEGGVFTVVAIVLVVALRAAAPHPLALGSLLVTALLVVAAALPAGFAGKLAGLALAKYRFRRACARLLARLGPAADPPFPVAQPAD